MAFAFVVKVCEEVIVLPMNDEGGNENRRER